MATEDGYAYVYENVGLAPLVPGKDGYQQVYLNMGFNIPPNRDWFGYVYEGDVNTATPTPHIWFVAPTSGRAGDGVVIYGHGMGSSQVTYNGAVEVNYEDSGWATVSITNWVFAAATADSYGAARMISPSGLTINVEHVEIAVQIPSDAEAPGQQVRFRTDGP